ncbi:DUF6916 family protein [Conexibacter woesei]|uniref:DUF6916 domain-containing protein n=1 Tax=Conexibacter woesei (strain DSM 14684 / CCUG 47730 / CIP 108061 / JCM 11494 / NBRC 100937 / ID131577) TaxID=469383 RepID=D3F8R1_CONWI|nr:hypothetical protein [Conexibacter woesei]ADB51025.1 conserved hypothetical protein [Conexibacter woesei DSM 14684]
MTDLQTLTVERFAATIGEPYAIEQPEGAPPIELVLAETEARGPAPADGDEPRQPFALVFSGPAEPQLAQQIVPLRHAALGRLEIFIVPIAVDADGARYEAVFA